MAYFGHSFTKVFVGTGSFRTTGHSSDLAPGEIGVFDYNTQNAIGLAGTTKNPKSLFVIGQGSFHKTDALSEFYGGLKESVRSRGILPNSIEQFWKVEPRRPQNEVWYIGYNGIVGCECLSATLGEYYDIRIDVKGDSARRAYNRDLYKHFRYNAECVDSCNPAVCPVPDGDPLKIGLYYAQEINNNPEISKFVRASVVVDNPAPLTEGCDVYETSVCDEGTIVDLGKIQAFYNNKTITRKSRVGAVSTYEICVPVGNTVADYNTPGYAVGIECETCPTGYTLVPGFDTYVVERPLAGTEDLTTEALQTAYATAVQGDYLAATASAFLGKDGAVARVSVSVPVGTALNAVNVDLLNPLGTTAPRCEAAGGTVAWTLTGKKYIGTRDLCITLEKCDAGATSKLAEVTAFFANRNDVSNIILSTNADVDNGDCGEVIQLTQTAVCQPAPECKGYFLPEFEDLPSFEGHSWTNCPCETETPFTGCVGLRLETAYEDTKFGDCSFNPSDYYNREPLEIQVSLVDEANLCPGTAKKWSVSQLRFAKQGEGFGETALRDYIKFMNYKMEPFCLDPRMREVTDLNHLEVIDRNKFYKHYFLIHTIPNHTRGMNVVNYDEKYVLHFIFDEGTDTADFEKLIGSYAALNGVFLESK